MKLAIKIFCVVLFSPLLILVFVICGTSILLYKGIETVVLTVDECAGSIMDFVDRKIKK